MKNKYPFMEYLNHIAQSREEAIESQEVMNLKPLTARERALIKAAYARGSNDAVSLVKLHGSFKFS